MKYDVELLAPAGTFEALVAAVQNGANAVYIGGMRFGARAFAGNFSDEELIAAVKYAHVRDVKIFVTVNTLIRDEDFEECMAFIDFLYHNDVDAVILQDVGLASEVHKRYPDLELHASTQMSVSNLQDALYYKEMGFTRIVLARENSIDETKYIYENTGLEIENFVHGALCVSYSGKCLFSYANGGRSSNQGSCAQPCRKKYHFVSDNKKRFDYFLSTKDLCTIKDVEQIIQNGTYSLKIEGRMKRPEYVATVVRSYRKAIDAINRGELFDPEQLEQEMAGIFNREFTAGLLTNSSARNIGNSLVPNNLGVVLGKITQVIPKKKRIEIELDIPLRKGDGLSLGEHVGRILIGDKIVDYADAGQKIMLDYFGRARVGDIVRKTSDKYLIDTAIQSYQKERIKIPLVGRIEITKGKSPKIIVTDNRGNKVLFCLDTIVETAQNVALSSDDVLAQIEKTEGTPYCFETLDVALEEGCFLKKSDLNAMRRNVLEQMTSKREVLHPDRKSLSDVWQYPTSIKSRNNRKKSNSKISPSMISVKCFTKAQIDACGETNVAAVYVTNAENYQYATQLGLIAYYCTPTMLKDDQIHTLDSFVEKFAPNVLTTSIGYAKYLQEKYRLDSLRLDYLSNSINYFTFAKFKESAIQSVTLSLEHPNLLDGEILHADNAEFPILIHPLLMFTEFCPYKENYPCKVCQIDEGNLVSEDGNTSITIKRDNFCRMQLFGQKPMDFSKGISNALRSGIRRFRIDLLDQNYEETIATINRYTG